MTRDEAVRYFKRHIDLYCVEGICREAEEMAIEALNHHETVTEFADRCRECGAKYGKLLKQEPCEDCISRRDALNAITMAEVRWQAVKHIEELPPVTPQRKMGRWIQTNEFFINQDGQFIYKFICSECKSLSYFRKSNKKAIGANVCPNCGAKMQEVKEWKK